jgi:collagenase-like PrtC family protease
MRILAPLKNSHEVVPLIEAGADEFFCGLTPPGWETRCGTTWANRRAPEAAGVQDVADFERIVALSAGRPVYVTLNSPHYPPGGVALLEEFAFRLLEKGASGLVIADMELLLTLIDAGLAGKIHVSSLATCTNAGAAAFFRDLGIARVILPRHLTLREIEAIHVPGVELEAFLLNDGCVFEEGLCATTHACGAFCTGDGEGTEGISPETLEQYAFWKWTLTHCGCRTQKGYPLGPCGVCAIPLLLRAGIASFKVAGREASLPRKEAAVRLASMALRLALTEASPQKIRDEVIDLRGVPEMCEERHLCYYPDVWDVPAAKEPSC